MDKAKRQDRELPRSYTEPMVSSNDAVLSDGTSGSSRTSRDELPTELGDRYSRQILFAGIGAAGQQRLQGAHAAVVGVGATGAATAGLLARAGVGRLTLIDRDFVEPSNLQRQVLFDEEDARQSLPKAEAARRHLERVNAGVAVQSYVADLTPGNAGTLLQGAELVLDGTDNFETRYLLNDLCVRDGRPWIYTAAVGAYAATMNVLPGGSPALKRPWWAELAEPTACLACLFPAAPGGDVETCETAGVLGPAVNLAASLAVAEALKFLTGQPGRMRRTLLSFDLWNGDRSEISTGHPRPDCAVCCNREFRALAGEGRPQITLCGRNSVQIHEHHRPVDLVALQRRLTPLGEVRANGLLLRFSRPPYTLTVFPDGRALVQGTTDVGLARSLYARYLGS
ncbi:MAG TPA: ThiF family adenylyltransferase [Acidobacteriaceae bacterium]|nr:ThiF family adenylyltransferase [Acidobacteriaceae bacterium]